MIQIYQNKRSTRVNGFRQLLSKTNIQIIEDRLFIKPITQKEKK